MKICLATKNQGKLKELMKIAQEFAGTSDLELVIAPEGFDPEETGTTFVENAIIKATEAAKLSGLTSVADDSGLCVDALDGRPGIYSARYAEGNEANGRTKLLTELKEILESERQAAFVCAMAVVAPTGKIVFQTEKRWNGIIAIAERGQNGFGYDPIFIPEGANITSAEMNDEEKNLVSHRGQAWRSVLSFLQTS
ncbi:MAG: RdgB/HAM1 family non-canonical purine NTP pyrophosphatase [Candidatus Obscuribacterales bacterium]|nr:RdgB/HAM1 family non-canonical purine NTP pyrophosphatase [Candidatus Obscuribacterales bacterium]